MTTTADVQTIIDNALYTANTEVNSANAAAQFAITSAEGFSYYNPPTLEYALTAIEPDVGVIEDALLTYEAQLSNMITLLSGQLATFFTTYYPLASDAFDPATNWLVNTITVGGTGISPAVEDQIWQRDRDRIIADGLRAESAAYTEFASRGFSLPPGALASRLQEVRFEQMAALQGSSATIAIEAAKLEIDNLKFSVEQAIKSRMSAMTAAVEYIRAIMSGPATAVQVANLNSEAKARMISATSELYRARLTRDEIALRIPVANVTNSTEAGRINTDGFFRGLDARSHAAAAAAQAYGGMAAAALGSLNSVAAVYDATFS